MTQALTEQEEALLNLVERQGEEKAKAIHALDPFLFPTHFVRLPKALRTIHKRAASLVKRGWLEYAPKRHWLASTERKLWVRIPEDQNGIRLDWRKVNEELQA